MEGDAATSEALRLLGLIRKAKDIFGMNFHPIQAQTMHPDINLDDDYLIKIIAPTSIQLDKYAKKIEPPFEEEAGNKPSGNWLATVLKIYSNKHNGFILLTSDSNKETLFYDEKKPDIFSGNLILAQCPHHGAEGNYKNAFWKLIKREPKTPIVISVGNNIYGHPAQKVIDNLNKNNYKIFATNEIGALSSLKPSLKGKDTSIHLSTFGEIVAASKVDNLNGDKIFEIDSKGNVLVL